MKLSTARDQFLADCRLRGLAASTIYSYTTDLNLLCGLANVEAADNVISFTPELVRSYFLKLAGKGLSAATLHRRRASVSEFSQWCMLKRLVGAHPMAEVPPIKRPRKLPRPFTRTSQDAIEAVELRGADALIRGLLFHAALRVSEVCDLRVGDVDLGANEQSGVMRVRGKGNKERVLPLTPELWHLCRDYMLSSADLRGADGAELVAPLLARRRGTRWTPKMVRRRARLWGLEANLKGEKVTPHRFRHTSASRMLEGNEDGEKADLRQVQEFLGHRDISTTAIYTEVTPERLRSAANVLSKRSRSEKVLDPGSGPKAISGEQGTSP